MNARVLFSLFLCLCAGFVSAQSGFDDGSDDWPEMRGDAAIAEKYLLWAEEAIAENRWPRARAALERAADFADVSSDISYLTALARSGAYESRGAVLQALDQAIQTNRWSHYSEVQARLIQADQLIALRRYSAALESLAACIAGGGDNADSALLRLAALKGLNRDADFRQLLRETMERYPRDTRHLRAFFNYASERYDLERTKGDPLMETALRRLPFLLEADPDLAWMAAPFIGNDEEARQLVAAYRSGSLAAGQGSKSSGSKPSDFQSRDFQSNDFQPARASIAPALNLGLLYDEEAVDELFSFDAGAVLDKALFVRVWELLRSEEGRDYFTKKTASFAGVLNEDDDRDGYVDSRSVYRQGALQEYYYDADQDGIDEIFIIFDSDSERASPRWARPYWAAVLPAVLGAGFDRQVYFFWERYPFVQRVVIGNEIWLFPPGEFRYAPLEFEEIGGSDSAAGLRYPRRENGSRNLSRRTLMSSAVTVYRPGVEFEGSAERVSLRRGVPVRAEVMLDNMVVSITEFENGRPVTQRLDLDTDGTMETVRRFRRIRPEELSGLAQLAGPDYRPFVESSETDRNGSGIFGSAELYQEDGSVVYSWDMDGDGIREYYLWSEK